jgi:thioredoxin 1
MATVEINLENFQGTIEKSGIVLLDFWAEWCGPCRMFAPVFEKASEQHADVVFGKVDTEAQQELAEAAGISAIPTLMLFRDGVLLFREAGALPAAALEQVIAKAKSLDMEQVRKEIEAHQHEHGPDCDHDHDHDHDHGHDDGDEHDGEDDEDEDDEDEDDDEADDAAAAEGEAAAAAAPAKTDDKH